MYSSIDGFFDIIQHHNGELISYAKEQGIKSIKIEININTTNSYCAMNIHKTHWASVVK
jgi:hypothetical protein